MKHYLGTTALAAIMVTGVPLTAMADEEYVIGVAVANSGGLAPFSQPSFDGFSYCVDQMNEAGGIAGQYPIRLEVRDTRSDIAEAVKFAQEFVDLGVNFIVAPPDGDPTMAMGQITSPAQIPTMTFAGTAPILTSAGDYVFGSYPADNQQAAVLGAYAAELGYETTWILTSPDAAYTQFGPRYFAAAFEANGGTLLGEGSFSMGQPDFSAIVTTIQNLDPQPDVIMTSAWEPDFPAFIRALRGAGVDIPVMGADVLDTPTVRGLGDVVEGIVHTSGGYAEPGSDHAEFNAAFEAATGTVADTNYVVNGCDILGMIDAAVQAAGSTDSAEVGVALANLGETDGIMSSFTFEGTNRMPMREVVLARIEGGEKIFIRRQLADPETMPAP
ncbi:ABC transporter substrate-binding protein [Oceaniradius stylonematis]|uniref:ABC transporter substrate-binding protein n=1 Tax=Oceaniradius stylonematis TaxID=2184161 RepID=UPI00273F29E3|nr:ABC transporter substrate-binding protein [Oceaniradius stylonematis]